MKLDNKVTKVPFLKELFSSHGEVSASRFMMFFTIILGFILNIIMIIILKENLINITMWGVLFGSLLPIVGIVGYVLAKGFETKLELNIGDKSIKLGNDGVDVDDKDDCKERRKHNRHDREHRDECCEH